MQHSLEVPHWAPHSRHWREFSISKNLVRISHENSRSITRNPFLFLVPFSKFKIWQNKFSISSRRARYRRYKSRSRLEAQDIEDANLDLVSNNEIIKISISSRKKNEIIIHIFCWNFLCNNFKASVLFLPPPYGIYVVHSHFPTTITPLSRSLDFWRDCSQHSTMHYKLSSIKRG